MTGASGAPGRPRSLRLPSACCVAYWLWSVPPDAYPAFVQTGTFALRSRGRARLAEVAAGDRVFVYLTGRQVVAGEFEVVGAPFEDATALVPDRHLPHRVRVRPVAVLPQEVWIPREGLDNLQALDSYGEPPDAFRRLVGQGLHALPPIDGKVLSFLVQARLGADPDVLMAAVDAVRRVRASPNDARAVAAEPVRQSAVAEAPASYSSWDRASATERLVQRIAATGFQFDPWQVAAFVTAVRTKPFVLLAGVTGVGKTQLPLLVAQATGGEAAVLPVRPDWTDSAEVLGYSDLNGRFRPGALLRAARSAQGAEHVSLMVLDEMNLGRPEHYLAEVLSRLEQRAPAPGGYASAPLLAERVGDEDAAWQSVRLEPGMALVGTVNVDESAHAFSRKVLDRAFVLELAAGDLTDWRAEPASDEAESVELWPVRAWAPRATRLSELANLSGDERQRVERAVEAVAGADAALAPAGLGVGYRARDEVALFVLHAADTLDAFRDAERRAVDPLDLALLAKLVPRIDGASAAVRTATYNLLGWALDGRPCDARRASELVEGWQTQGRPAALAGVRFPRTAARLARVAEGALDDGVATFWA